MPKIVVKSELDSRGPGEPARVANTRHGQRPCAAHAAALGREARRAAAQNVSACK